MSSGSSRLRWVTLLGLIAFGPLAFGCVEPWSVALLQALMFSLLILGRPGCGELAGLFLALACFGAIELCSSRPVNAPAGFWPATACRPATASAVLNWLAYAALAWSIPGIVTDERGLRRVAWGVFLVGAAVAFIGLIQAGDGRRLIYGLRPVLPIHELFGPYYNRDHAANLMSMSLMVGLGLALSQLGQIETARSDAAFDLAARAGLTLFLAGVIAWAIWRCGSRGGLQSAAAGVLLLGWLASACLSSAYARWGFRAALLAAACGYAVFLSSHTKLIGLAGGQPDSQTSVRLSLYRSALAMLSDAPVFGRGLGAFIAAFPYYQERGLGYFVEHAHNDWLELLVETGAAGLAFLIAGVFVVGRGARRSWQGARLPGRLLRAGLLAAAAGFALHGCVDFSLHIAGNAAVFLIVLACLGLDLSQDPETPRWSIAWPAARAACAVLAALALRPAVANVYKLNGDGLPPEPQARLYGKAARWSGDPENLWRAGAALAARADAQTGAARSDSLHRALALSERALSASPVDRRFRHLEGDILARLGRAEDARRSLAGT